jgi:hypothetical protein
MRPYLDENRAGEVTEGVGSKFKSQCWGKKR